MEDELQKLVNEISNAIDSITRVLAKLLEAPVIELDMETFNKFLLEYDVAVILFTAEWCQPCKVYTPLFKIAASKILREEHIKGKKLGFGLIDTDRNPEIADRYGIENIPATVIFVKGHVADVVIGAVRESELIERIRRVLKDSR